MTHRGVNYDVGTAFFPGTTTRPESHRAYLQQEIETIARDLHCTSVGIFGSDIERLVEGVTVALDAGLHVRVQPRFIDVDAADSARLTADLARAVNDLREPGGPEIILDIGCELTLFAADIIAGETFEERIATFIATLDQLPIYNQRLNDLLGTVLGAARSEFAGQITYSSGVWEAVDWSDFDLVGVDLYRDVENVGNYVEQLRSYQQFGKPVVITEFGCCCFEGADLRGGGGYDIIDWSTDPPTIPEGYVRSETVQVTYLADLIDIFYREQVYGAFIYQFVAPDEYHDPDNPRLDLDMANFSLVKAFGPASEQAYETTGYLEPKESFAVVAERYRADA